MSPLVKIHVVCERRVCRKQTVRRWIRQKTSLSAVFFCPVFVVAAKFKPLLGHSWCNQGFLQRFAGRKFKTFVHTISNCSCRHTNQLLHRSFYF